MAHLIEAVQPGGIAFRRGLRPGDSLIAINGEPILDEIDYQALSNKTKLDIQVLRADGKEESIRIIKAKETPLGLQLADTLACKPRACKNKCVFCFIDQMPPSCRKTLYVKDDDWRMSLMMGNFITLTNVDDEEFARILKRKVSPLYISVHATNPDVRVQMMRNPNAGKILERLTALKEHGIKFHCQIVLCPGINDGKVLEETLSTLTTLAPAAQSAALVPVGLTKYRDNLYPLTTFNKESAANVLSICRKWQKHCLETLGSRFVFPSDEMLCIADESIPDTDYYENFPQIENGVGLMRKFLTGLITASQTVSHPAHKRRILIPCGQSIAPYMKKWITQYAPAGVHVHVVPIKNRFFGETVTVTGLLTGQDILDQIQGITADEMLLCCVTLRAEGDLFLDDMSIDDFRKAVPYPVTIVENRGDALFAALCGNDAD